MNKFVEVSQYIANYVLQSYVWDNAPVSVRKKAVNRAELMLRNLLPDVFSTEDIPVELLGEQTVWVMKIDDTIERADFGMKNVWVDGTMITIADKDNSLNPLVLRMLGISVTAKGLRRKTGGYYHPVGGTGRWGAQAVSKFKHRNRGL